MSDGLRAGVLFDVDGTLVDTNYLHTLAWSRAFASVGEWAPMNAIHRLIGMGGDQLVSELLDHECPPAEDARAREYEKLIGEARVLPGAAEPIRALDAEDLAVVLASSAPEDELRAMQRLLDVSECLTATTSSSDADASKPAPDIFLAALKAGSVDPKRAIVVGDSIWDVQAARAAGLACVGVETGGFSAHELREEGAIGVYEDCAELLAQLRTSPLAPLL